LRVVLAREEVEISVTGGPAGHPLLRIHVSVSKNNEGHLTINFKPNMAGHFMLQAYIFGTPLLDPPLKFEVIEDGTGEDEETLVSITNPIIREKFSIPLGNLRDKQGRTLGSYCTPQNVMAIMVGPAELSLDIVYGPNKELLGIGLSQKEGYYTLDCFDSITNDILLERALEVYLSTPDLQQQIAFNNKHLYCNMDGFALTLNPLTNARGKPYSFADEDLSVDIVTVDREVEFKGQANKCEDGVRVRVSPPQTGTFIMQVSVSGPNGMRPILTRPLVFTVS